MGEWKGRAFWERVVAEVEAGASQSETARRYGVSPSGLGGWVRKLHRERARPAEPRLLPVRVSAPAASRRCSVVADGFRVDFEEGTDPAYIAALARAVRGC